MVSLWPFRDKSVIYNYSLLLLTMAFVAHQVLQYGLGLQYPLIDHYLDPFLFMPLALHLMQWERRQLADRYKRFSFLYIVLLVAVVSLVSELLFPFLAGYFYADWKDVIAFFLGGLFYYVIQ